MEPRTLASSLKKTIETFPAIVLTGPRQSGKTTLLKDEFQKTHRYINLEVPEFRLRAKSDPMGFLEEISGPVILDEIQYVPELLPFIKNTIDENRKPGNWILTGSQNFVLMQGVSESLAGRAAVLSLLPFSLSERNGRGDKSLSVEEILKIGKVSQSDLKLSEVILRGNYPEIASNNKVDRQIWCGSYITTYLERDVRNLKQVGDLGQYEIFLRACAARTGQILDLTSIAREIGISFTTAKCWLSLLETGYQVLLVYPYYRNIGKRLVKRPKMYFTDTGLASYLLGLNSAETLVPSSSFGPLFETLVVTDFWKRFLHHGQAPSIYYLRTRDGLEVDLIIELEGKINLVEIKASASIKSEHLRSLITAQRDFGTRVNKSFIISNSKETFTLHKDIKNISVGSLVF